MATRVGNDSAVQKLVRMVSEAEQNQAPMQRIVDKWASWLVPLALLVAVLTYFVTGDITRAVTVLVVFCPCALVLGDADHYHGGHRAGDMQWRSRQVRARSGNHGAVSTASLSTRRAR